MWIWACIAKRDMVIWCFEEYLWLVFKVLLKNSYGVFWLDLIEFCSLMTSSMDEWGLRTFERVSLLEELVLKEICISKNSFSSLNWGPLFIETCKGSQVLFNVTWYNFIDWYLLTGSCIYDKISWISHPKYNFFYWPRNIWRLIYFPCHIFQFYFIF